MCLLYRDSIRTHEGASRYSDFVKEEPMRMHRLREFAKVLFDEPTSR